MTNISSKQNAPKLKWWHKGALVGLGLGLAVVIQLLGIQKYLLHYKRSR